MSSVGIAKLKASLSEYLRRVRRGETLIVLDRDAAIARIVPIADATSGAVIRRARGTLGGASQPRRLRTRSDIVELLMEERGER